MKLDDLLYTVKIKPNEKSHIKIKDPSVCKDKCEKGNRPCLFICPAKVYSYDEKQQKIIISHERCLEDGACYIACPHKNINWKYPEGGSGVSYKFG